MAETTINTLDPIDGLVSYTLFTKPYHSKILEVLVEYIYTDCLDVTITEDFNLALGMPDPAQLPLWGWTLEEAKSFFNCDFKIYQVCNINKAGGYFEIVGNYSADFIVGEEILYQNDPLIFNTFTITNVETNTSDFTVETTICNSTGSPSPDCSSFVDADCAYTTGSPLDKPDRIGRQIQCRQPILNSDSLTKTRISVSETINVSNEGETGGTLSPARCWSINESENVYTFRGGITWPSTVHVAKNINCGGFGIIWDSVVADSVSTPITSAEVGHPDEFVGSPLTLSPSVAPHFEVDNTTFVPFGSPLSAPSFSGWSQVLTFGATFEITDSLLNNGVYTVLYSQLTGSVLRVFVIEKVNSNLIDGNLRPTGNSTGYDSPTVCLDQGQSLGVYSGIHESLKITINDNAVLGVESYDGFPYDISGFDGGSFDVIIV